MDFGLQHLCLNTTWLFFPNSPCQANAAPSLQAHFQTLLYIFVNHHKMCFCLFTCLFFSAIRTTTAVVLLLTLGFMAEQLQFSTNHNCPVGKRIASVSTTATSWKNSVSPRLAPGLSNKVVKIVDDFFLPNSNLLLGHFKLKNCYKRFKICQNELDLAKKMPHSFRHRNCSCFSFTDWGPPVLAVQASGSCNGGFGPPSGRVMADEPGYITWRIRRWKWHNLRSCVVSGGLLKAKSSSHLSKENMQKVE